MKYRVLMGNSFDPYHNLAVEALLFEALKPDEVVFYLWQNAATVVIGRHQNAWQECRVQLLEAEGGRLARRSTGGGAVFHDLGNLNFSFVVPRALYDVERQLNVIRRAVAAFGIDAAFTGRNDLTVNGAKFSGNAFRFSEGVGLHHGTILVSADMQKLGRYLAPGEDKLRAKGIRSVRSRVCNLSELRPDLTISALKEALIEAFTSAFGAAEPMEMSALDGRRLSELESLYGSWDFRMGKALPFDAVLSHRFDWGGVQLELSLKHGRILQATVYSDAMDEAMIARIAPLLEGVRYDNSDLAAALSTLRHPQANDIAAWLSETSLG